MQILAHRGFWREKKEQNSLASLAKAFEMGFGIETDLRDGGGGGKSFTFSRYPHIFK